MTIKGKRIWSTLYFIRKKLIFEEIKIVKLIIGQPVQIDVYLYVYVFCICIHCNLIISL